MITRLRARNFKSFDTLDVELGRLNVFVGGNASGKSNLLSLLTFMRDLTSFGLEDAVSLQGGATFLQNLRHETGAGTEVEWFAEEQGDADKEPSFICYRFLLKPGDNKELQVAEEDIVFGLGKPHPHSLDAILETEEAVLYTCRRGDNVETRGEIHGSTGDGEVPARPPSPNETVLSFPRDLLTPLSGQMGGAFGSFFSPVFNFDLHALKQKAQSLRARSQLEEDGSNVALVLRDVLKDAEKRRSFLNLLRALLPFVKDLSVDRYTEESLVFQLKETFADTPLPPSLLSDGTIQAVALILAMYFDDRPVIAFEEPARSLHPRLVERLVQMMDEASQNKQILLTTHNPEFLRHTRLDDVHFVSRDEDGFSQVTRPKDSEMVQAFLSDELGLNDLFVDDLLNV